MVSRQYIVDFARSFKGTPYKHQGRSVNGIDCVGILVLLGNELDVYHESERRYSRNPKSFGIKQEMEKILVKIDKKDIKYGDILLFRMITDPQHVGVVTEYSEQSFGIVHCYQSVGKVVEHRLNDKWIDRIVQAYKVSGVY